MATIVLQAGGALLGGLLGPVGAAIGSAAGALAGYVIDRALIDSSRRIEGPRLSAPRPFTAEEGASLPRIYGTMRVGGTMIWATRFEEKRTVRRQGAKGGPKVTEYTYFGNVAFALCEGEIGGIRRIWADGREIDRESIEIRVYRGTEDQLADPLIEAKQGAGKAPAYRGVAYVVIERLSLADFGNRIPQFQFEVIRPIGGLRDQVKAVVLIPGATEYGLSPLPVVLQQFLGMATTNNRHVLHARSDLAASLDELQMICPNLEHVAVVATWFGDDLRAGQCRIRPGVVQTDGDGLSLPWLVSGIDRILAMVMSTHGAGAAFGGSPSDKSVLGAISEIKSRGLKVTLYPFVMMDVPEENGLPNPYGGASQPAYPWRGRITCHPAPTLPGTADKTASARSQVSAFCGSALPAQYFAAGGTVFFSGAPDEWGYRRFLLHFAHLAHAAGGVDGFLIGSELRGLTALRDETGAFPFVNALCTLAGEVRTLLGPDTAITYGADWTEYFGHRPADGSGDVLFHLDPLWAHPAVTAVGIDNYMPLSDWRDADYRGGNPDGFEEPYDIRGLRASITSGEGFDWYYSSEGARRLRERSPITDGAYGKPWVFRHKDLLKWWSEPHYNRLGGIEEPMPTAWVPRSKPFWLTELGCPAVDKGPNQPNVFPDAKSVENAIPYFSNGGRSDLAMMRFLQAHFDQWDEVSPNFDYEANPESELYDGRMVDASRIYLWAWDARPFPAFPLLEDEWADGPNWHRGHWLNGRLGSPTTSDLINAILADHGLPPANAEMSDGTVAGYLVADPSSARQALEPLIGLFDLAVFEEAGSLVVEKTGIGAATSLQPAAMISEGSNVLETVRMPDHQLPTEAILGFSDPFKDFQAVTARAVHPQAIGFNQLNVAFPGALEQEQAKAILEDLLRRMWTEREKLAFALPRSGTDLAPGSLFRIAGDSAQRTYVVAEVEEGIARTIAARQIQQTAPAIWNSRTPVVAVPASPVAGLPLAIFLDLPAFSAADTPQDRFRVAVWRSPWRSHGVFASPETTGYSHRAVVSRQAVVGTLTAPLQPGVVGRLDRSGEILVRLFGGEAASIGDLQFLNGGNTAAVRCEGGGWEVVQFQQAEEISPDIWRLSRLLRAQLGTEDAMVQGAATGAHFVLLDDAVQPAGLLPAEIGLPLNWRVGAFGTDLSDANFSLHNLTGGVRSRLPLSPVHLKAKLTSSGDIQLSWVRRGRVDADDWAQTEIPIGEGTERYELQIAPAGGTVLRTQTTEVSEWLYPAAAVAADFGAVPSQIDLTVRQLSLAAGWGIAATSRISIN